MPTTYVVSWTSADRQGWLDGGTYATLGAAEAAVEGFRAELLSACADDEQRAGILAGRISIDVSDD